MYRSTFSLTQEWLEVSGQLHALGHFTPTERAPGTHWIGGAGLDDVEKREFLILPGPELRPLGHPARSQSLYRLRYKIKL
jgi:hypothetical protein